MNTTYKVLKFFSKCDHKFTTLFLDTITLAPSTRICTACGMIQKSKTVWEYDKKVTEQFSEKYLAILSRQKSMYG